MGTPSRVPLDSSNNNRNLPLNDVYILVHHSVSVEKLEMLHNQHKQQPCYTTRNMFEDTLILFLEAVEILNPLIN